MNVVTSAILTGASVAAAALAATITVVASHDRSDAAFRSQMLRVMAADQAAVMQAMTPRPDLDGRIAGTSRRILQGEPDVATIGPRTGKPIVEFMDYNCGYCRRFTTEVLEPLAASRKDVTIRVVHAPILGPGSRRMALFAVAAQKQGRFAQAHAYLTRQRAPTEAAADALKSELVRAAGLNAKTFDRAISDGSAELALKRNERLSQAAGVTGTPVVYVNGRVSLGAPTADFVRTAL